MEEEDECFCGEPEAPKPEVKPKPSHKQRIRGSNNIQAGGTLRILVPIDSIPECDICGESRLGEKFSVNPVKRDGYSCSHCYHTIVLPARIKAYEDGEDWPIV